MRRSVVLIAFLWSCQNPAAVTDPREVPQTKPQTQQNAVVTVVPRTTKQTLNPRMKRLQPNDPRSPIIPQNRMYMMDEGFGEIVPGPGIDYMTRVLGAAAAPAPGPNARRLTHFVHLSDLQLADDESPARVGKLDSTWDTNAAFRPHEGYGCRIVTAAVSTINAMHREDPLDFVLLGGDNVDNAQDNELDWVFKMLNGDPSVDCDSGDDDDLTPGPDNDVKDPFTSPGLLVPYKWVTGNHDIEMQGNLAIDDMMKALAVGTTPKLGTRDYKQFGAPVVLTEVPADPRRKMNTRKELMARVAADGDGHGVSAEQAKSGKAYYHFDVPNTPLRFVILDTAAETGGSEGILRKGDMDAWVRPVLDDAVAKKKLVIMAAHHATWTITTSGGTLGATQPDAMSEREWLEFVGQYPNILYSIVGHSHEHKVFSWDTPSGTAFWEVLTASLLDFPGQFREIEIFDQDNGWLMLRATCIDYSAEGDVLVNEGRQLMFMDWVSGWGIDGHGEREDLNVELWVKKPF